MAKKSKGFTLIELMIVVAIIGIITSIAFPNYVRYVTKSKRSAAQALMLDIANREKQYFLDARTYTSTLSNLGISSLPSDVSANYTISINTPAGPPPSFTITATPIGGQVSDGAITLTDTGVKSPSGKW